MNFWTRGLTKNIGCKNVQIIQKETRCRGTGKNSKAYRVYLWIRNIQNVRIEHSVDAAEILKVKHAIEKERPNLSSSIITYHLETDNINRYKTETYEEIYRH